jgi:tetratricopeptide (TPR) repeat protein
MRALAIVALLIACLVGTASADDDAAMTEARAHATTGQAHFDAGEYESAIREFRVAYALVPRAGFLYNLAQAYRLDGDCVAATKMYRDYLARAPRSKMRTIVEQHIADLEPCVRVRTAPRPGRTGKRVGLVTAGVGVAVTGVGTWLALSAPSPEEQTSRRMDKPATEDENHRVLATAMITGGAVATLAGAALYYLGWRDAREAPTFTAFPIAHGAGAAAGWRF